MHTTGKHTCLLTSGVRLLYTVFRIIWFLDTRQPSSGKFGSFTVRCCRWGLFSWRRGLCSWCWGLCSRCWGLCLSCYGTLSICYPLCFLFCFLLCCPLCCQSGRKLGRTLSRILPGCRFGLHHDNSESCLLIFRWFKFTLKPPNRIGRGKLRLAIWDTSFWTFWVKFGHNGPWDIS